jgi:hypothetical protein
MNKTIEKRYLESFIKKDLKNKMVFLSGPRQVGKTTLALRLLHGDEAHPAYLNWDSMDDQDKILNQEFPPNQKLIVFDEIHKYSRWRNYLKGLYDKTKSKREYLVTGSARLDLYKKGGDALTGRYHSYQLHPLSVGELDPNFNINTVESLLKFGGFPEPFFMQSETELRRWQMERKQQVLRDDLRDLERVEEVVLISQLADRIPELVGSPLSINALREDLQVAHGTASNWLNILERLYVIFRIAPFGYSKIRAVKKEMKAYLWDWSLIADVGSRFKNMVACQLLKYCHFVENTEGYPMELRYIRDTDKREIDFVVIKSGKPLFAVECKTSFKDIPQSMFYFSERLKIPSFYLVHLGKKDFEHATRKVRVLPFNTLAKELSLP